MEEDDYVAQLREVFDSCDTSGNGYLTREELIELCQKLQLEDQVPKLLAQLLGDNKDGQVTFEEFKEGFVIVLSDAIDGLTVSSGDELPQDVEEPPKLVVNEKRYGRRSRPFDSRVSDDDDGSGDDGDVESISSSRPGSPEAQPTLEKHRKVENGDAELSKTSKERRLSRANSQKLRRRESLRKRDSLRRQESVRKRTLPEHPAEEEILEASGQISNNAKWSPHQSVENLVSTSPTEEEQLRTIWDEVNVGANGFLDKHELSVVCEHIGMDGMQDEELSLLFDELDDDHDGQVSFQEFLHGLFIAKDKSQSESDNSSALNYMQESPRARSNLAASKAPGEAMTSTMRTVRTIEANLLQTLDPGNSGMARVDDVRDLWQAQENEAALEILKHAEIDSEGNVSLSQLTALLESSIYERSDAMCQAVVSIFKHELAFMRSQTESMKIEKEKLIENAGNLINEKAALIHESEEHTRQLESHYDAKLRKHEEEFNERLHLSRQEQTEEHEKAIAASLKRIAELEKEIAQFKGEEQRNKQLIEEHEEEIGRLDSTLNETNETLGESERVRSRLEKELGKVAELSKKLGEVESQRDALKQQQTHHATKGIRELEKRNRELRDENDELLSQIEMLKSQAKSGVKRNRSHRRRTTDRLSRVGSVLSDYTKPVIVKKNKEGLSSSEEEDHVDGRPTVVRVSGDGGSNEDEKNAINTEQRKTIEDLEGKLVERDKTIKDLENTVRQQEQNIKAKDGSINKQKTTLEKLKGDCSLKDNSIKEKIDIIEQLNGDLKIKEDKVEQYKEEIQSLEVASKGNFSTAQDQEALIRNLRTEVESLKRVSSSESSELKGRFNKELSNLTSQFTSEMEDMQQRFASEKEELEQAFQVKYNELEGKCEEKHRRRIAELEAEFKNEKELFREEKSELENEFQKQKQMLEKFYVEQMRDEERKHSEEMKRLEEMVEVLREEKKQLQNFFDKEKIDIGEQFAAEKAEIEQEKAKMEQRYSEELEKERERFVREKTNSTVDYEEVKQGLHEKFSREKLALEKSFEQRYSELERNVTELRQVFTDGQEGLKGQLKEDFLSLLSQHKKILDAENKALVDELKSTRESSVSEMLKMQRLGVEVENLKSDLEQQRESFETALARQREILELEMDEKFKENEEIVERYEDAIKILKEENIELKEHALNLEQETGDLDLVPQLEEARRETDVLNVELGKVRQQYKQNVLALEETVQNLNKEKDKIAKKASTLEDRFSELESENTRLKRRGEEPRGNSWKCTQLEEKVQMLESENGEIRRSRSKVETEQKREIERLKNQVQDLEFSMNRRNDKVLLAEKARKELCSLEQTVEDMEKERKILESSLYQQNIKNTSLQDEISDLKRRYENNENRFKKELDVEKEKVDLVKTEMSTLRSKHLRELDDVRERLGRALSSNTKDQSMRDKILNDAKVEILTLSDKLEAKAKKCRELEEERSLWEERMRGVDRQRREMELRMRKTHDSVDERVTQLNTQLQESQSRSIRTDTLVQELYIENARLTKTVQEVEGAQKKAEKSNRQLQEQKRALQRVISKLCGANALA